MKSVFNFSLFRQVLTLSFLLIQVFCQSYAAEEIDPVHYAYSNYLGSGIYHTTGQNVTLISMPFSYELGMQNKTTFMLRLPVSFGFVNFDFKDLPELNIPEEVGTFTFTPGIQFDYQYSEDLVLQSYFDLGYARNLTTNKDVIVHSFGAASLYSFILGEYDSIWANRIYYAAYNGHNYDAADAYAAIQIGLDTGLPYRYQLFGYTYQPRIFASAFWYFSEVDFTLPIKLKENSEEKNKVTLSNSFEFGIAMKFEKTIGYSWVGIDTIGLSYRFSENVNAVRLLFSFPI